MTRFGAAAALALTLLAAAPARASSWRDVPCGEVLAAPQPATRDGCAQAHCSATPDGAELCACRPSTAGESGVRFTLSRGGVEERRWTAEPMFGDSGAFRASHGDLDGDGRDELVVATLRAVSNGMAVQYWSLCVLDGARPTTPPACIELEDYPFFSQLTRQPHTQRCRLLVAQWRWGSEPRRGDGLYLVGRWHDYADGALRPTDGRPLIARRYLYDFAARRARTVERGATAPILWYRDRTIRVVHCPDPLCTDRQAKE